MHYLFSVERWNENRESNVQQRQNEMSNSRETSTGSSNNVRNEHTFIALRLNPIKYSMEVIKSSIVARKECDSCFQAKKSECEREGNAQEIKDIRESEWLDKSKVRLEEIEYTRK